VERSDLSPGGAEPVCLAPPGRGDAVQGDLVVSKATSAASLKLESLTLGRHRSCGARYHPVNRSPESPGSQGANMDHSLERKVVQTSRYALCQGRRRWGLQRSLTGPVKPSPPMLGTGPLGSKVGLIGLAVFRPCQMPGAADVSGDGLDC
jgi:hypothetical protein